MTPTERQRIEKEAKFYFDKIGRPDDGNEMRAYIAGAITEHDKARNQAIDDVIKMLTEDVNAGYFEMYWSILKEQLEQLKKIS